jgi:putative zinc finger protein
VSAACGQFRGRLPEYLDDVLSTDEARALRGHLVSCGDCRNDLAGTEPALLFARVSPEDVSPEDVRRVVAGVRTGVALMEAERKLALGRARRRSRVAAIASAAAVAAMTLMMPGSSRSRVEAPIAARPPVASPATGFAPAARTAPTTTFPADATIYDWNPGTGTEEPRVVWIVDRSLDI